MVLSDYHSPNVERTIEECAEKGAAEIRLFSEDRSPGPDPLAAWRKASDLDLPLSVSGKMNAFITDEFRRLVEGLPDLVFVLEHLPAASVGSQPVPGQSEKVLKLAQYPNVYVELPGFGELHPKPMAFRGTPDWEATPFVRMIYESFGSRRIMWGSDFPPCAQRGGLCQCVALPNGQDPFFQ